MRPSSALPRSLSARLLFLCALVAMGVSATAQSLVISQVYGGGGNSGATYTNDFVELFNPTASPITLTGASLQYGSATGTSYTEFDLPSSFTVQPGHFYLIQAGAGAGGTTPLPSPDATITAALSATAGKVALVASHVALSGASCNAVIDPNTLDYVGFGTSASCFRGAGPAPTPSNTTADIRIAPCSPTNNNNTDFSTGTPIPRNSSTTAVVCSGNTTTTAPAAAVSASPASVYQGSNTLLTARTSAGANPSSTGLTVTANLSAFGGSTTQPLYDDGSNGDVTAGDGVFSYQLAVTSSAPTGSQTIQFRVADAQMRSSTASTTITVVAPAPAVAIRDIQSAKPSPYAGKTVMTQGIVTSVKSNGFYLEAQDADTHPTSPEGILVYTGTTPPASVAIGTVLQLTGTVSTYPSLAVTRTPGTEIDSPQGYTVLQTGVALPAPITITSTLDSPTGGIYQFARYEGMRVAIPSFTTTSGTDGSLTENTETITSTGQFYGTVTGIARPFREPGISVTETALPAGATLCPLYQPSTTCIPQWDSNPELLLVDSRATGGSPIDLTSLTTLTNVSGVMDFSTGGPDIILDRSTRPTISGGLTAPTLPVQAANEFTVATFNLERFYNDQVDEDNPGSSAVTLTTAAFQRRLAKDSLAIRNVLNSPDILGVQEMENLATLTSLAQKISADAVAAGQPDPAYQPFLFLANDGTAINTGLLVKGTVTVNRVEQVGLNATFTNATGQQAILNDRTPLVAHLAVQRAGQPDYPVTMIVVHQRSLINIDDTTSTGATVRLKREAQAEFLANLIQSYQGNGEHVVTVGDFNAFQFNDGYVDATGVSIGNPVPAAEVVQKPAAGLVTPNLIDLVTTLPASLQQSYVEDGSAQVLDHILATPDLAALNTRLVYVHIDADFPLVDLNDATSPLRVSDHDPAVAYFALPGSGSTSLLSTTATLSEIPGGGYQQVVTVTNNGTALAVNVTLKQDLLNNTGASAIPVSLGNLAPGASASATFTFPASVGNPGAHVAERINGTYNTGGNFAAAIRTTLP